jgi:predicted DsbA family dithiol-disulfide isomerase
VSSYATYGHCGVSLAILRYSVVTVTYYTDPACPWSWSLEPVVRKLMIEFGDALRWRFVMGGLARDFAAEAGAPSGSSRELAYGRLIREWLRVADRAHAPIDPLLWVEAPLETSYPACMAVKAAEEQATDGGYRYLRRLREGVMCERRKLDHIEALVEEGRSAGLDVERFRLGLRSHAITEAFGADLEATERLGVELALLGTAVASDSCSRTASGTPLPSVVFGAEDGSELVVAGFQPFAVYRDCALASGAQQNGAELGVEQLIERFGRVTTREVELISELPGPRVGAELFRLAEQWRVRPVWRMTGYMWETP